MGKTITSFILLGVAATIFFMYTQPTYDKVGSTKAQIAEYDAALTKATELQQLKQTLLSRYNAFNPNDLDRLQKLLPDHVDNVRLILDLDSIAQRHGMALQNVVVSTPGSDKSTDTAASAITASKTKYDAITLKFTTQSTYDNFLQFILDLEESLRIVDVASLKLTPVGSGGQPFYSYDITIRTYWLK